MSEKVQVTLYKILSRVGYATWQITSLGSRIQWIFIGHLLLHALQSPSLSLYLSGGFLKTVFLTVSNGGYTKTVFSRHVASRFRLTSLCLVGLAYIGVLRTRYQTSFLTAPLLLFRWSVVMRRVFCCPFLGKRVRCYSVTIRCYDLLLRELLNFHVFVVMEVSVPIVAVVAAMDVM
jgi:hypothetical protein